MRRLILALACGLALAGSARAEKLDVDVGKLLGVVPGYFGENAVKGRAILVENEEGEADLRIYLEDRKASSDKLEMKLALTKKSLVFSGPMGGQEASLALNGRGSILVRSLNIGIGRNKWEQALTILYKGGEFQIVGITYSTHDGLNPKAGGSCDLNLATGRGKRNNRPVTFRPMPIKVADWSDERMPGECKF